MENPPNYQIANSAEQTMSPTEFEQWNNSKTIAQRNFLKRMFSAGHIVIEKEATTAMANDRVDAFGEMLGELCKKSELLCEDSTELIMREFNDFLKYRVRQSEQMYDENTFYAVENEMSEEEAMEALSRQNYQELEQLHYDYKKAS